MSKSKLKIIPSTVSIIEGGSGVQEAFVLIRQPMNNQFNQSELDFIKLILGLTSESVNEVKQELQDYREVLWNNCDKENPDTEDAFLELNRVKNQLKKLRVAKHKIQNIYTKIKAQSKGLM